MANQSDVQRAVLAILPKVSSVLSMCGSSAILAECFYFERKRLDRVYNRLLCVMAMFDILESIFNFASTWMITAGANSSKFAAGNDDSCTAQGFFLQLGLTSPVLNAFLSWYYLLVIRYSWSEEDIKEKAEPWIYIISLLVGFGTSIAGVPLNLYHPGGLWCWINPDDSNAPTNNFNIYRYALYFIPLFMCFFIIAFNMSLLTLTVRKLENASKRYMTSAYKAKVNRKAKKTLRQSSLSAASSQSENSIGKSIMNFISGKKAETEDTPLSRVTEEKINISERDKTNSQRFRDLIKKQDEIKKKMESNSSDMSKIMELKRNRKSITSTTSTASKQSAENAQTLQRSVSFDETLRKRSNSRALYSFLSKSPGENHSPYPTFKPAEKPILDETPLPLDEDLAPEIITNKSSLASTRNKQGVLTPLTSFPEGDESERESSFSGEEEELTAQVNDSLPGGDEIERAPLNVDEQEQAVREDASLPGGDENERALLNVDEKLQTARVDASLPGGDENERAPLNVDEQEQTARVDTDCSDEHSTLSDGPTGDISKSEYINDAPQFSLSMPNLDDSSMFPPIGSLVINNLQMKSTPILSKEALRRSSTTSSIRSSLRSNLEWSESSFLPEEKDIESIRNHLQELNPDQSLNSEQTAIRSNGTSRAESSRRASESNEPLSFHMRSNYSIGEPSSFSSATGTGEKRAGFSVSSMREAFRSSKSTPSSYYSDATPSERKAKKKAKRKTKSSMVTEQALFYVISFLLTFMWSIGSRFFQLAEKKAPYAFLVGNAFFDPLQGFINYLVYIRPKLISYRKRNPNLTRLQCIKALITHVDVEKDDDKEAEEGAQKELLRWRRMKKRMKEPKGKKTSRETRGRGSVRFVGIENSVAKSDIEDHRLMEEEERDAREASSLNGPIVDVEHQ